MEIQNILAQVDAYFEADRGKDAEQLLQQSVADAEREQDDGAKLQLLNELIGYYRESSQHEMVYKTVAQAIAQTRHCIPRLRKNGRIYGLLQTGTGDIR